MLAWQNALTLIHRTGYRHFVSFILGHPTFYHACAYKKVHHIHIIIVFCSVAFFCSIANQNNCLFRLSSVRKIVMCHSGVPMNRNRKLIFLHIKFLKACHIHINLLSFDFACCIKRTYAARESVNDSAQNVEVVLNLIRQFSTKQSADQIKSLTFELNIRNSTELLKKLI